MFDIKSPFKETGDQPQAIKKLIDGLNKNIKNQCLLGVTGSGKTFTTANVINKYNKPTLILCHNKTLAAQLYSEFKYFFPNNSLNILFHIMIIINQAYLQFQESTSKKIYQLIKKLKVTFKYYINLVIWKKRCYCNLSVSCIYGLGNPNL